MSAPFNAPVALDATKFEDSAGYLNTFDLHYWLNWNGFSDINLYPDSLAGRAKVAFATANDGRRVTFLLKRSGSN